MNYLNLLKRAFHITLRNRVLWVFGILLALTGGSGGGGGTGPNFRWQGGTPSTPGMEGMTFPPSIAGVNITALVIGVITLLLLFLLVWIIISVITRYVSENALIRMVDRLEEQGDAGSMGNGFRLGWSRPAFRIFLMDLIVGIPLVILSLVIILLALSPLLLLLLDTTGFMIIGILLTIGFFFIAVGILVILGSIVDVWSKIAYRQAALNNRGTLESLGLAFHMIRRHLRDIVPLWLIMIGIGIGVGILMIPVSLILLVVALTVGGIPALIIYALSHSVLPAALIGVPLGLFAWIAPLMFISGLVTVFVSSLWTLLFRELSVKEASLAGNSLALSAGE